MISGTSGSSIPRTMANFTIPASSRSLAYPRASSDAAQPLAMVCQGPVIPSSIETAEAISPCMEFDAAMSLNGLRPGQLDR